MTKVSRVIIDPRHFDLFLNNFWNLITLLENKEEVKKFLKDVLTHTEMKMLVKRIQIAKMLVEGYSYRDIRNYVKVTDETISKISNILGIGGEGLKIAIEHLQKIEKKMEKERTRITPNFKKKYPMYFLPEIVIGEASKKLKARRKKRSVK